METNMEVEMKSDGKVDSKNNKKMKFLKIKISWQGPDQQEEHTSRPYMGPFQAILAIDRKMSLFLLFSTGGNVNTMGGNENTGGITILLKIFLQPIDLFP